MEIQEGIEMFNHSLTGHASAIRVCTESNEQILDSVYQKAEGGSE